MSKTKTPRKILLKDWLAEGYKLCRLYQRYQCCKRKSCDDRACIVVDRCSEKGRGERVRR